MNSSDVKFLVTVARVMGVQRRRKEAQVKTKEWAAGSAQHIARWAVSHERNQASIGKVMVNLEKLEAQLAGKLSDKMRDRVQAWVAEGLATKAALEERNSGLEQKIRDLEARLDQAGESQGSINLNRSRIGLQHRSINLSINLNKPATRALKSPAVRKRK